MSFNRMMANVLASSGTKLIHGEVMGNINPYEEWIKWLSYIPEFQKTRIQELNSKTGEELTSKELEEIKFYKKQFRMLELFKIYGTDKISKDEYMEVYNYMINHSIDELMLSKLSVKELKNAKEQIQYFTQLSNEELREKILFEQKNDNYKNLSMVDSYILHIISRINYKRNMEKLDNEIKVHLKENALMRERSLYYATNSYLKK